MIIQPENLTFSEKKFSIIVYGSPGVGKTTLALSAPNPVLIDFDKGVSRVKAHHRKPAMICRTYEEVLRDVESPEMSAFDSVIIDTGGAFVACLQEWAIRTNPAQNRQKNGALSLKGFGAVKQEFQRFTNYLRDTLDKNVIYVFHSDEQKDKDGNPIQRLQCEGATRNLVWQPCDLGGYVQMIGGRRMICFTPQEEFFAKGCFGIEGAREVPQLAITDRNDFLTRLFEEARQNIADEAEAFAPIREQYDRAMEAAQAIIDGVKDAESATSAVPALKALDHALTSLKECSARLNDKAASLGLAWDKAAGAYKAKEIKKDA